MQKILFISDLHLEENQPHIAQQFIKLLQSCDNSVDALYILGDLFEIWIGDDDDTAFHREIKQALRTATRKGLPIYFIYGNRDFLIGHRFLEETGCTLLPDEAAITVYQTPVLVMHGDTLCTRDVKYIKARKKTRNIFLQKLFLMLPLFLRKKMADQLRAKSKMHTRLTPLAIMDVTPDEVARVMQAHQVGFLIHGHTHKPYFHPFTLNHQPAMRIVLGAWHQQGSVLVWDETGGKELIAL